MLTDGSALDDLRVDPIQLSMGPFGSRQKDPWMLHQKVVEGAVGICCSDILG